MSQENVESVRRANAAFNRRDPDAAVADYHPDVQWRDLQHAPDAPERLNGRDALLAYWAPREAASADRLQVACGGDQRAHREIDPQRRPPHRCRRLHLPAHEITSKRARTSALVSFGAGAACSRALKSSHAFSLRAGHAVRIASLIPPPK